MPRIRDYPATVIRRSPRLNRTRSRPQCEGSQSALRRGTGGALGSDRPASTDPCPAPPRLAPAGPPLLGHGRHRGISVPGHHLPRVSHPEPGIIPLWASVTRQRCPVWNRTVSNIPTHRTRHQASVPSRHQVSVPLTARSLYGAFLSCQVLTPHRAPLPAAAEAPAGGQGLLPKKQGWGSRSNLPEGINPVHAECGHSVFPVLDRDRSPAALLQADSLPGLGSSGCSHVKPAQLAALLVVPTAPSVLTPASQHTGRKQPMWNHPNKTQSNWDRPAPFSSLHRTSPLELKDVYFHEETNPQFPKAEISPKCIPYALGRAMSSRESPVVSPKILCTFTRSATPKLLPAPLLLYPAQLLLQRKILGVHAWESIQLPCRAANPAQLLCMGRMAPHAAARFYLCYAYLSYAEPRAAWDGNGFARQQRVSPSGEEAPSLSAGHRGMLNIQWQLCPPAPGNPAAPVTATLLWLQTYIH